MRRISAAIQFTGAPKPLNRPCKITKSPSATMVPGSYLRWRKALDEIEQAFTARRDMSAVLDIVRRPKLLSGGVVALIEQRVESFQDEGFVPRFNRMIHFCVS